MRAIIYARYSSDLQREASLVQWRAIVEACGTSSTLFVQMADDPDQADASFHATFHGKPAATLTKRAGSLLLYARWAAASDHTPFPVDEPTAFAYLCFLSSEGAPPSRGQASPSAKP